MHKDIGEDIYRGNLRYTMISLFSSRINVLIIGAGKAALIKAKTFLSNGCNVSVVAKEINEAFYKLDSEKITITTLAISSIMYIYYCIFEGQTRSFKKTEHNG